MNLPRQFLHFAGMTEKLAPLYAELSRRIAEDEEIMSLCKHGLKGQPSVNLLFGSVTHLLLGGASHDLREFHPTVGGSRSPTEAWPAFKNFCQEYKAQILELVGTKRVQTNEVGRCGVLLPAFALAAQRLTKPLHLLEVGCSAGFLLNFDRYSYSYDGYKIGPTSSVSISTALQGDHRPPLPKTLPEVARREGLDLRPVDVHNEEELRWNEAMVWPQLERLSNFRGAAAITREHKPALRVGEALELLPTAVKENSPEHGLCIFHSHATYQMTEAWRLKFSELLQDLSRIRDFVYVSLEWLYEDPCPQLHLTHYHNGTMERFHLAEAHHHGNWLRWQPH